MANSKDNGHVKGHGVLYCSANTNLTIVYNHTSCCVEEVEPFCDIIDSGTFGENCFFEIVIPCV